MALTDKVEIVFSNTGRRKKVLVSWLLSESAMFAMEAAQFIINDKSIKDKIEGQTFAGKPVKPQLIMRYPYLRTIFDEMEEEVTEEVEYVDEAVEEVAEESEDVVEEVEESVEHEEQQDYETVSLSELNTDQLKAICDEREIEYDGRKRKQEYFIELIKQNGN